MPSFVQLRCSRVWLEPIPGAGAVSLFLGLFQAVSVLFQGRHSMQAHRNDTFQRDELEQGAVAPGRKVRGHGRDAQPGNSWA